MLIMFIFDVDYDYICCYLCLFGVFFSLCYSGADNTARKKTASSGK